MGLQFVVVYACNTECEVSTWILGKIPSLQSQLDNFTLSNNQWWWMTSWIRNLWSFISETNNNVLRFLGPNEFGMLVFLLQSPWKSGSCFIIDFLFMIIYRRMTSSCVLLLVSLVLMLEIYNIYFSIVMLHRIFSYGCKFIALLISLILLMFSWVFFFL